MVTPENTNRVALEAYYLWEREGRPEGRALDHWLAAEGMLEAQEPQPLEGNVVAWDEPPAPDARPASSTGATSAAAEPARSGQARPPRQPKSSA